MLQRFDLATLTATPWKNGGGSTREIVCRPDGAGLDGFDWRVSLARIAQAGPFSAFAGVDRTIMLLEGDGVRLQSASGLDHRLDRLHAPFEFPGEVALDCSLLGGPSTDLNVMTRRGTVRADIRLLSEATAIAPAERGLLLALRGRWRLQAAASAATAEVCTAGQGVWWDAAPQAWSLAPQHQGALMVWVFLASFGA